MAYGKYDYEFVSLTMNQGAGYYQDDTTDHHQQQFQPAGRFL